MDPIVPFWGPLFMSNGSCSQKEQKGFRRVLQIVCKGFLRWFYAGFGTGNGRNLQANPRSGRMIL